MRASISSHGAGVDAAASRIAATSASARSARADPLEQARGPSASARAAAAATSGVSLPSRRSSPTGLPVTDCVAEHAEQVVAQLERLAEREAERR